MAGSIGNQNAAKYTGELLQEIIEKLQKYIQETEMPIVAEFCYKNDIPKSSLYNIQNEIVKNLINKATAKKETYLEREGLKNEVNTTMAIFSLKQLGWSDKQEIKQDVTQSISADDKQEIVDDLLEIIKTDLNAK